MIQQTTTRCRPAPLSTRAFTTLDPERQGMPAISIKRSPLASAPASSTGRPAPCASAEGYSLRALGARAASHAAS